MENETIREFILRNEIRMRKERIEKLQNFGTPYVVIQGERKFLNDLENGIIKISGDTDVLYEKVTHVENKKGRNDTPYVVFNKCINYFPFAKYGRYIKRLEA